MKTVAIKTRKRLLSDESMIELSMAGTRQAGRVNQETR